MRVEIEKKLDLLALDIYLTDIMGPGVANECRG